MHTVFPILILSRINIEDYLLPCLNKSLTGLECPGCGLQRASVLVMQGDFKSAFFMYPAIYTLIVLFVCILTIKIFSFRNSNQIIMALVYLNAAIILISYLIKITTL